MLESARYIGNQIFRCSYAFRLSTMFVLTGTSIFASTSTPFLFSLIFQGGGIFLGYNLSVARVVQLYATVSAVSKILPIIRKYVTNPMIRKITYDTVYQFEKQLLYQPHSYQASVSLGTKQEQIVTAKNATENVLSALLHNFFPAMFEIGTSITVLSYLYSWQIGIGIFGLVSFATIYNALTGPMISRAQNLYISGRMAAGRYIAALWKNFESVYFFNTLNYELKKLIDIVKSAQEADLHNLQLPKKIALIQSLVSQGVFFGLMIFAGNQVNAGSYTGRDLAVIVFFMIQIVFPLNVLGESASKLRGAYEELATIINLLNKKFDDVPTPPLRLLRADGAEIIFDKIRFSYKPNERLLEEISFTAKAGETTAIVGTSGSGKSTLIRLLYRFYEPSSGRITYDGQDIAQVSITSLRNSLSIVPQNPVLFNNTLRYNLSYGAFSIYEDEQQIPIGLIGEAISEAGLSKFVSSLAEGLDKKVGENALMISGGQLQRLALARALVRKAPVVVLDECTSALDSKTEEEILKNMALAFKGKTVITIAHRLSTIRNADKIVVIDNGRVCEEGNFDSLMTLNGVFAKLYQKQLSQTETEQKYEKVETFANPVRGVPAKRNIKTPDSVDISIMSINSPASSTPKGASSLRSPSGFFASLKETLLPKNQPSSDTDSVELRST